MGSGVRLATAEAGPRNLKRGVPSHSASMGPVMAQWMNLKIRCRVRAPESRNTFASLLAEFKRDGSSTLSVRHFYKFESKLPAAYSWQACFTEHIEET